MTVRGNPGALALGPGLLYIGPLGTTEPVDLVTDWGTVSAGWVLLGYTDSGSEFKYAVATDTVDVAEELDPIFNEATSRSGSVSFSLAEITATNLKRAMNGGTITTGTGIVTFEPPDLGSVVRTMLGFQSEDGTERWVYRQCFQTGDMTISRAKGASKATISCEFMLEKPATGSRPWKSIMASPLRA